MCASTVQVAALPGEVVSNTGKQNRKVLAAPVMEAWELSTPSYIFAFDSFLLCSSVQLSPPLDSFFGRFPCLCRRDGQIQGGA